MKTCARAGGCAGSNYPFLTQKERDIETGLDYFLARYYSSSQGRFSSADSFAGSRSDPQSLNLYTYSLNNPLKFVDPDGHWPQPFPIDPIAELLGIGKPSEPMMGQDPKKKPLPPTEGGPLGTPIEHPCIAGVGCGPVDLGTITVTADPTIIEFPGIPRDAPGETIVERYLISPVKTALEVADWASKGVRKFGYAVAPDYGYAGFSLPLMAGGNLQYSKDRHLYGSYNFFGYSGGNYNAENLKNWKAGLQLGAAYFATTEMRPADRDAAIQGPGLNATTGPVGGYFPLSGGPPAVTVGWPFTNLGVNVSRTHKIY